jgi:hypothetical protein
LRLGVSIYAELRKGETGGEPRNAGEVLTVEEGPCSLKQVGYAFGSPAHGGGGTQHDGGRLARQPGDLLG